MDGTAGALAMAAGGLWVAAAALARSGQRAGAHRGWTWWLAAAAVGGLGAALASGTRDLDPWLGTAVQAVLLTWPVLMLTGLRRFHGRVGLPGRTTLDLAVGGACLLVLPVQPGLSVLALHLYVAAIAWSARTTEDTGALRLTGAAIALAALPLALAPWTAVSGAAVLQALGAGPALLVAVFAALASMSDRTERELRQSRQRLRVLASTDPLTGVSNRRHFDSAATRRLRDLDEAPPVLLLFDIDHFKVINDRLGHSAGDRALRLVGRCIQEALRAGDLAGRLGGDEFALMLGGASLPQAMSVAERIVAQLQTRSPEHRLPMLTLSFGLVQPEHAESLAAALHRADRALYEAKRQGRSRAVAVHGNDTEPQFSESQRLGLQAY